MRRISNVFMYLEETKNLSETDTQLFNNCLLGYLSTLVSKETWEKAIQYAKVKVTENLNNWTGTK